MIVHSSRIFLSPMNYTQIKQKWFPTIPKPLVAILIVAFFIRLSLALVVVNFSSDFYWEYGEIAKNVLAGRGYSLYYISNDELAFRYNTTVAAYPTALMAPGYVGFLLPFMFIRNVMTRNIFIILVQTILSLLSLYLVYKFTAKYFSERIAFFSGMMACILPDIAYSVFSFTPTVLYHLAVVALLLLLYSIEEANTEKKMFSISLLFVFLSYIRGEFLLFVFLFLLLQIFAHQWKNVGITLVITISLLSPWTIRNYTVFDQFVPLSTGFGLNFYRGNNSEEIGSWSNEDIKRDILSLPQKQNFEVQIDRIYQRQAFNFIISHPWQEISNIPVKLFHLWVFSPLQKRSNNYLYQLISLCFFIFSIIGLLVTFSWQKHRYLYLMLIYSMVIGLLFFTLPRHQTMMKIILLPLAGAGLEFLWNLFKQKRSNSEMSKNNHQVV